MKPMRAEVNILNMHPRNCEGTVDSCMSKKLGQFNPCDPLFYSQNTLSHFVPR